MSSGSDAAISRRNFRLGLAALGAATFVAFAPVLAAGFVNFDDPTYVTENPRVLAGLSLDGLVWAATTTHAANWHPLTWISHQLDVQLFGLDARGHHLTSLLLHVANAVLAAMALERLTGSPGRSLAAAALFALHPLRVESVAWIAERKDLLAALFVLLALLAHASWARRGGALNYTALLVASAAAVSSKPMAVTLPFLLLLLDAWPLARLAGNLSRCLAEKLPLFAMVVGVALATVAAQSTGGALAYMHELPLGSRLAHAVTAPFEYLALTLWPRQLSVLYPHPYLPGGAPRPGIVVALAAAALAAVLLTTAWTLYRRRGTALGVGGLWFLGTLVPVLGLVQVGEQGIADRYTYLPHLGLFLAFVWGGVEIARRTAFPGRTVKLALIAILALLAVRTSSRAFDWRDAETLYESSLAATPTNPILLAYSGTEQLRLNRVLLAEERLVRSIELRPYQAEARDSLALVYLDQKREAEAVSQLEIALRIHPRYVPALRRLAFVLARQGDLTRAIELTRRACEAAPEDEVSALQLRQLLTRAAEEAPRIPAAEP